MEGATSPLDYLLLGIMRDKDQDVRARLDAAKAAAPYCHTRLSSTELSGPSGGPVSVQTSRKLDISSLNDEELEYWNVRFRRRSRRKRSVQACLSQLQLVSPKGAFVTE